VVWGAVDPNPAHQGRAEELLASAGISVTRGVCQKECEAVLRPFSKYIRTGIPWVTAKSGISLDGRITRPAGEGRWITSPEARQDAMALRLHSDAILVGAGTVRADNPSLTLRGITVPDWKPQPWRVVLTRRGDVPFSAKIFTDAHHDRTLVFSSPLPELLQDLAGRGVMSVLIEGGGEVLASAFAAGVVDDVVFYMAPLISGSGLPVINSTVFSGNSVELDFQETRLIGPDLRIHALVRKGQGEAPL
ncbi:MAG: bifunctional diaminohydroxyphosphoribosylaminopyrimidine deaminase/5-amino-6-(5-phosphoribosylamino)uracil reductase RibD, partial [Verrucomicrobiaceae bacterium]